jgi:hypothetical protein
MNAQPDVAAKFVILLPVLALIGLAIFWAVKSKTGRWVVGITAGLLLLLFVPLFYVRTRAVHYGPPRQIRVEDSFQAWRETQVMRAIRPDWAEDPSGALRPNEKPEEQDQVRRPEWVDTAGNSTLFTGSTGQAVFHIRMPGPNGGMVGYSGLEPTPDAALESARKTLREQLKALVEWELARTGRLQASQEGPTGLASDWLAKIPGESETHKEQVKLRQSGETAYRAAVLARLPTDWAAQQASALLKQTREAEARIGNQRVRGAWTFFSAGILALVIFILYAFLNAGTKGHLAWTLRIVSVAAFLVLCYGLLVIRGHW